MTFKKYDKSLMGHLNFFGMILFSLVVVIVTLYYPIFSNRQILKAYIFFSIYIVATSNINKIVFPYSNAKPEMVYINIKYTLRHLYFVLKKGYTFQVLFTILLSLFFAVKFKNLEVSVLVMFSIITVMFHYFSLVIYGLFQYIYKVFFLFGLFIFINFDNLIFGIYLLFLLTLKLIFWNIFKNKVFSFTLNNYEKTMNYNSNNIFKIVTLYIRKNLILLVVCSIILIIVFYFAQGIILKIETLPVCILIYVNLMTILEILIGNSNTEIMIDKYRIEHMQASNLVNSFSIYKSSTLYLLGLIAILLNIISIISIYIKTNSLVNPLIIQTLITTPVIYLITFTYSKKIESLNYDNKKQLLKFSLLILLIICMSLFIIIK